MPTLFSLAKVAIVASCVLGLTFAEPAMFNQQDAIADFGKEAWSDVQHVFQSSADKLHSATDKLKEVFSNGAADSFTAFSHPAFPEYVLRYKKPTLCDPNVKQVTKLLMHLFSYFLLTHPIIDFWLFGCWRR